MRRQIKVVLLGMGTVGAALSHEIVAQGSRLGGKDGYDILVVAVADSRSSVTNAKGLNLRDILQRKARTGLVGDEDRSFDHKHVLTETQADMMVMLTPADPRRGEPALAQMKLALQNGLDVVTANKVPLALRYKDLIDEALRCGRIEGVLNATSNFILSEMETGANFDSAVKDAREQGYAEANPSLDVDGIDAACKIVILGNHVLNRTFRLGDVSPLEGITGVSTNEMRSAFKRGKRFRMVATAEKGVEVRVAEIPVGDAICVSGADNAVRFECRRSGPRVIRGPAGGGPATSAAVIRDILAIGKSRFGA